MKKLFGFLLVALGAGLIIFSILVLVIAFDGVGDVASLTEHFVYILGKVLFPLLLSVLGRWVFRKGVKLKST